MRIEGTIDSGHMALVVVTPEGRDSVTLRCDRAGGLWLSTPTMEQDGTGETRLSASQCNMLEHFILAAKRWRQETKNDTTE